jgi:hypothetical protein
MTSIYGCSTRRPRTSPNATRADVVDNIIYLRCRRIVRQSFDDYLSGLIEGAA